jgi:CheY-like chemotaxis protein
MTFNDPNKIIKTRFLDLPPVAPTTPAPRATGPLDRALPWVIEFRVVGTSSILQAQVRETMLLGRTDVERDILPEIDLTPYNAGPLGVSRRHAMIVVKDNHLMLKDMGSTNGTRLNDSILEPLKEYRLHHGDQLMLGQLHLQLQYAVVPASAAAKPSVPSAGLDATIETSNTGANPAVNVGMNGAAASSPVANTTTTNPAANSATSAASNAETSTLNPAAYGIASTGKGQRVLVIEDDDNAGEVFKTAIEEAGYKVTLVKSVIQGLGVVFHQMPDAIVLDMMISDMNALDLVRYVRKQNPRRIPVLVVSSGNGGFFKSQAYQAGADVFMGKPVAVEELVKSIGSNMAVAK